MIPSEHDSIWMMRSRSDLSTTDNNEQQVARIEVHNVEEGEISDSASIEEISEETFNTTPPLRSADNLSNGNVKDSNSFNGSGSGSGSRVWTMRDIYRYPITSQNSYSRLYSLAWAQGVVNKPLEDVLVTMDDISRDNNDNGMESSNANNDEALVVKDEVEMEEGELEEGEIDLESESVRGPEDLNMEQFVDEVGGDANAMDTKKRVNVIKKELESLSVTDGNNSCDSLCSRLEKTADNLLEMVVLENDFPERDTLVQLLFTAIRNTHYLFFPVTRRLNNEQNGNILIRLLARVTSLQPPLFSSLQLKEMEIITSSLKLNPLADYHANNDPTHLMNGEIKHGSTVSSNQPEDRFPAQNIKLGLMNSRPKALAVPLLDLHKDHDADSLPSPTRELSAPSPFGKAISSEHKPEWPVPAQTAGRESAPMHRYETDVVRAVSSYQQKFGRRNFLMSEKLPSPTPSEEGDETVDSEISGEVSSSVSQSTAAVNSSIPTQQQAGSSASVKDILTKENRIQRYAGPPSTSQNPAPRSSAKSRDPRIRLANFTAGKRNLSRNLSPGVNESNSEPHGVVSIQKRSVGDELLLDSPAVKRQRNDSATSGAGGWLEDNGTVGMIFSGANHTLEAGGSRNMEHTVNSVSTSSSAPNAVVHVQPSPALSTTMVLPFSSASSTTPVTDMVLPVSGLNQLPILTSQSMKQSGEDFNAASSLSSLLIEMAVNPSRFIDILNMGQAKSSESIKSTSGTSNSYSMVSTLPSTNGASSLSSVPGQIQTGTVETPRQEDSGKVRMKPRDPRRMLHNGALKKGVNAGSDQSKATSLSSSSTHMGNSSTGRQEDPSDMKSWSHSGAKLPDITMQFTEGLRNVADIVSVSQVSKSLPVVPQNSSLQPSHGPQVVTDAKSSATESALETTTAPTRPAKANAWSDFDDLFGAFDNEQKAAIQIERAKRLEEQKKMFANRKLSLVLDLDHTLLNSAKFVEVDPQHDEILRKKEAQDREKPQRDLFRFPHMGMWTKLRPGIWNFLEKASKLYELHLYTMGNKYYATEMAKLLDPSGELFAGRVISRGDDGEPFDGDERVPKTKDLEGVLGMEPTVVIIDDSVRVWPNNRPNLIVVERYIYFPCSRRQFGLSGPSLLEIDHDERPEDGTLASSLAVIERIHADFFAHQSLDEADVRAILASEQRKILSGCRIVFSRIFPVGEANPHLHPLWIAAEQFGASCTIQIDEQVTHVVAISLGTDKVNWALSRGKFVVHPGWVEASTLLYRRANEHDFAIK